ncbi:substrate-binding domain-containing protein [Luteolibacter algae]|uniref:Substrate-binding domain-containing protein n=1 Tax=Luteolibacter algae TaxID=454151 RepID=A0ABW5D6P9_9BACT
MKVPKIAILVDTATGWGRRIVRGVLDYAIEVGPWDVWINPSGRNEQPTLPQGFEFDGVVARITSPEMSALFERMAIPVVNVSGIVFENCNFPRVTVDNEVACSLAEAHLRDRGLSQFAYVGRMDLPYVQRHEQAFQKRLAETGTDCHIFKPEQGHGNDPTWPRSDDRLIPWLKNLPKPIGIYTWGFQIGRDLVSACRQAEISVPNDVAILAGDFDDLLSDACHPPLSGVVTPAREIGFEAASILHRMLAGQKPPEQTVLMKPKEVVKRLSTETMAINDSQLVRALNYLREHACENIQVEDILKEVPMARRSLERRFIRHLGRSPAQEIRRVRIERARKLLSKTNLSIQEVAEACGYATYNYLGTVFKEETGISPGKYRLISREPNPPKSAGGQKS